MYSAILRSIKLAELFLRVFVCQKPTDLKGFKGLSVQTAHTKTRYCKVGITLIK